MDDALCGGGDSGEGYGNTAVPLSASAVTAIKAAIFMGDPRYISGLPYEVGTCLAGGVSSPSFPCQLNSSSLIFFFSPLLVRRSTVRIFVPLCEQDSVILRFLGPLLLQWIECGHTPGLRHRVRPGSAHVRQQQVEQHLGGRWWHFNHVGSHNKHVGPPFYRYRIRFRLLRSVRTVWWKRLGWADVLLVGNLQVLQCLVFSMLVVWTQERCPAPRESRMYVNVWLIGQRWHIVPLPCSYSFQHKSFPRIVLQPPFLSIISLSPIVPCHMLLISIIVALSTWLSDLRKPINGRI